MCKDSGRIFALYTIDLVKCLSTVKENILLNHKKQLISLLKFKIIIKEPFPIGNL